MTFKKLILILISPLLMAIFLVGLVIYFIFGNKSTIDFVFDIIEYLV